MRKFTYTDINDWKVVDVNGAERVLPKKNKQGVTIFVSRFDGYRSASQAAMKIGGRAVRA